MVPESDLPGRQRPRPGPDRPHCQSLTVGLREGTRTPAENLAISV